MFGEKGQQFGAQIFLLFDKLVVILLREYEAVIIRYAAMNFEYLPEKDGSLADNALADNRQKAYTQTSGGSKYCDVLGGLADQDLVGSRGGAGADPEQGIEGGMPRAAPVEAEHELIEVVLKIGFPQSVVDAQAPTLEV